MDFESISLTTRTQCHIHSSHASILIVRSETLNTITKDLILYFEIFSKCVCEFDKILEYNTEVTTASYWYLTTVACQEHIAVEVFDGRFCVLVYSIMLCENCFKGYCTLLRHHFKPSARSFTRQTQATCERACINLKSRRLPHACCDNMHLGDNTTRIYL